MCIGPPPPQQQQQQQQQQQVCDCILGVCACPRGLTHADPAAAAAESHFCSIDPAATPSFLPRVHPLLCKTRCVRTQQYARAKQEVIERVILLFLLCLYTK